MISHNFPNRDTALPNLGLLGSAGHLSCTCAPDCVRSVRSTGCGPLCVEFHTAARLQRPRLDPWFLPLGSRPRRLRGTLLLPGAGSSRDRRRGERADGGDRGFDRALRPVLGSARAVCSGAVWDQRNAENRRRGSCGAEREPEASCGNYRDGGVCRSRSQVSDLGARPFPKRARGGHPKGARAQRRAEFPGRRRAMRPEHGDDGGRRRLSCRWRTGPPHSRARPPGGRPAPTSTGRRIYRWHLRRGRLHPRDSRRGRL